MSKSKESNTTMSDHPWAKDQTGAPTLSSIASLFKEQHQKPVRNVVVLAGAGISTASGIPDFRSPKTGLYANLRKYNLPYPEAIFDIDYFREKPQAFFTLSKDLYPGNFKPTLTHSFLKLLHDKERLLRVFTQNIDTLERLAGLTSDKIVEAHGSFATSRCIRCHHEVEPDWMRELCLQGQVAYCPRTACKEKSGKKGSLVKPDIVFFGEGLPDRFFSSLRDLKKADLLIVLGTSLQVNPFASLVHQVSDHCPRVLINLERVGEIASYREGGMHFLMNEVGFDFEGWTLSKGKGKEHIRDVFWQGNCDEGILELAEHLGWKDELLSSHQKICAAIDAQNSTTRLPDPADETLNHARDTAAKAASSVAEKTDAGDKESNILSERMAQLDVQCEHHDTTSSPTKESTSD